MTSSGYINRAAKENSTAMSWHGATWSIKERDKMVSNQDVIRVKGLPCCSFGLNSFFETLFADGLNSKLISKEKKRIQNNYRPDTTQRNY